MGAMVRSGVHKHLTHISLEAVVNLSNVTEVEKWSQQCVKGRTGIEVEFSVFRKVQHVIISYEIWPLLKDIVEIIKCLYRLGLYIFCSGARGLGKIE